MQDRLSPKEDDNEGLSDLSGLLRYRGDWRRVLNPKTSAAVMRLVDLDADESTAHVLRRDERGAGTGEWVQDDAVRRAESANNRLQRGDRICVGCSSFPE